MHFNRYVLVRKFIHQESFLNMLPTHLAFSPSSFFLLCNLKKYFSGLFIKGFSCFPYLASDFFIILIVKFMQNHVLSLCKPSSISVRGKETVRRQGLVALIYGLLKYCSFILLLE